MAFKRSGTSAVQLLIAVCAIGLADMENKSGSLEHSASSMAILLIMAGDVEQNPGPLPPASASPESRALRYHSASLITAITDPLRLSWKLFSAGVIEKVTKNKANIVTMTIDEKSDVLLSAVMSRVETDPSFFHQFIGLLKDDGDAALMILAGKLEDTYREFAKADTEQHTLSPPPAKQPKLSLSHIKPLSGALSQPSYSLQGTSLPHLEVDPHSLAEFHMHFPDSPSCHHSSSCPSQFPPPLPHHSQPPFQSSQSSGEPSQSPLSLFINHLRAFYQTSELPPDDKWPPSPSEKFINLAVISREKVSTEELERFKQSTLHGNVDDILEIKAPIEIQDILKSEPGKTLQCVLIEGAPGVGKTTLAWTICTQWGRGRLFQQYAMVILVTLRDMTVQNAKTLGDLIFYNNEDVKRQIVQHLTHTDGKNTLIVLEGLDELPQHLLAQSSIFTDLLSGKELTLATILITSRPSATVQLWKNWKRRISRHIEVLGFTEKDIFNYIQYTVSPQELPGLKKYLSTNPNIKLMMYMPIHAAIVVAIYRYCQKSAKPFPSTTTELYTRLVQTILLRYLDNHPDYKNDETDIDKFTELPSPVYHNFYKLTELAFDGIIHQKLTFHDQHKAIEHLGFMDTVTEHTPFKRSVSYSYSFLHLSVQEYLAAYFVSLKSIDEQQQLLKSVHMCTEQHLRNMGQFLAGITRFKGMDRTTVKAIIENECRKDFNRSLDLSPYTLQLLHESGDYTIIEGHPSYSCRLTDYSTLLSFSVLGHCISNSSYKWRLTLGDLGQYMCSIDRINVLVQTLKSCSDPSYTIERIYCYYEAPECVQHLLLGLPQNTLQQIQALHLYGNIRNPQPLPQCILQHILSNMNRLHTLKLHYGAVSNSGAIAIADLIRNNTIQIVDLANNSIGNEGIKALNEIRELKKDLRLYVYQ